MNELNKVLGRHLLILAVYTVVCAFFQNVLLLGILIGVHTFSLFITSIVSFARGKTKRGKRIILSALLVGLIGFSACYGIVLHTVFSHTNPHPIQHIE